MSKSPSLRRIQADIRELTLDPSDRYHAEPLEDDMYEWHFTIRGADGTDFEGGIYHGRILLPTEYPFKPPNIVFLTPSGRFETGVKVCLSFSAHHPELWQPAWGIRLILEALISFLPTPADGAIGSLDWTSNERKRLAKKSTDYCCTKCGHIADLVPPIGSIKSKTKTTSSSSTGRFQEEIEKLKMYQQMNEAGNKKKTTSEESKNEAEKDGEWKKDAEVELEEEEKKKSSGGEDEASSSKTENPSPKPETKPEEKKTAGKETGAAASSSTILLDKQTKQESSVKEDSSNASPALESSTAPPSEKPNTESSSPTTESPPASSSTRSTSPSTTTTAQSSSRTTSTSASSSSSSSSATSFVSEPILHGILVTFAVIVVLLYHKVQDLLLELQELEQGAGFSAE